MGVKDQEAGPALTDAYVRRNLFRSLVRKVKGLSLPPEGITITPEMISMYREVICARRLLKQYAKFRKEI